MKKFIRWLSLFLAFIMLLQPGNLVQSAAPRPLTLSQAVGSALGTSYEIKKVKNEINLKKIELWQAVQAIKDIRKKENTIKFSLLFNIKFPEKHALPKEIDLLMKVPKIQSDIKSLDRKVINTTLNVKMNAETTYFDVVEMMETCNTMQARLVSDKSTLKRLNQDFLHGKAMMEDIEELKKSIAKLEKDYQSNLVRYENLKNKLSDIIGMDVTAGYTFSKDLSMLQLERSQLDTVKDFCQKNDYTVYTFELSRKTAETEVATLRNIYNNRWGSMVSIIENEIAKNGPIDYTTFLDKYNAALNNIEQPYQGNYIIPILFIILRLPKEWFRGELSGIRYFEDQKYALYISLMNKDKAVKEEQKERKNLNTNIDNGFNTLMELWTAYQDALKEIDRTKAQYQRVKKANLVGDAQFMDVESAKNDVISAESTALSTLIAYNKSLSSFDFATSGYISKLKSGANLGPSGTYDSGVSWLPKESSEKPMWYLKTLIDEYKFTFGVSIPEGSGIKATDFELSTEDGQLIGTRTPTDKTVSHIPLAYQGTTKLMVKLYNETKLAYTAEIDAADYMGILDLKPVEQGIGVPSSGKIPSGTVVGKWSLGKSVDKYTSILYLEPDPKYNIAFYQLETVSGSITGSKNIPIKTPVSHLTIVFNMPEKLSLKLFDAKGESLGDAVIVNDMDVKVIKMK